MMVGLVGSAGSSVYAGGTTVAPSTQADTITFTSVVDTSMTINWNNGSGNSRIVLVKSGSAVDSNPVDGINYSANSVFGSGSQLGTGNYVVYLGTGTSVNITGLSIGVTYHVRVYELNEPAFKYLTITASGNPASQATSSTPTTQASKITFSNIQPTSITIGVTRGSGAKVLIVMKAGSAVSTNPSDNTTYTASTTFGSGTQIGTGNYVVYASTGSSVTVTGLTFGTTYHVRAYEYGGGAGSEKYLTTTVLDNPNAAYTDYLGATLIDEWISNYGITLRSNNGDFLDTWKGYRNSTLLTRNGSIPKPVAGILPLNATGIPQFANQAINVNGGISVCFLLTKSATTGSRVELFTANSTTPTLKINLETAAGNTQMSVAIAGTTYSSGASFTYDGNYHALCYTIDPTAQEFKVFMDGAQVGSTQTIPNTAINLTSVNSKTLFAFQYTGNVKKFRLYNEAISSSIASSITNTSNPFFTTMVTQRNARIYGFWGQSNMVGSSLVPADYPAYLQGTMDNVYTFESFARYNFLPGTHPTSCGPEIKSMYDLRTNYPNDDLFFTKTASANTALYDVWNSSPAGSLYTGFVNNYLRMVNTITAEGRTISELSLFGMQGEEDARDATQSAAYETNLTNFNTNIRVATGLVRHVYGRIHSHLPTSGSNGRPYASTVRTADDNVDTADANAKIVNTDDNSAGNFELKSDSVHFNATGQVKLGASMASTILTI